MKTKLVNLIYTWLEKKEQSEAKNNKDSQKSKKKTVTNADAKTGDDKDISTKISPKKKKKLIVSLVVTTVILAITGTIIGVSLSGRSTFIEEITKVETVKDTTTGSTGTTNGIDHYKLKITYNKKAGEKDTHGSATIDLKTAYAYISGTWQYATTLYVKDINKNLLAFSFDAGLSQDATSTKLYLGGHELTKKPSTSNGQQQTTNGPTALDATTFNYLTQKMKSASYEKTFNWSMLISMLMPLLTMGLILFVMYRMMKSQLASNGGESLFSIGKSPAKLAKSEVKFTDVAGLDEEKEELIEIVDYLKNPQKYVAMGARSPKGVILFGPPGTGKTLLAKAVAGEAGVPFFEAAGASFDDMLVGVGTKRIKDLFSKARKAAPAIIFIDEIDSAAGKRGGRTDITGGSGPADQTINQLLAELDGFNTSSGVVVMGATNRLDSIDDAILRPGRFDRHIEVNLPDIKGREEILKIHARNKNISKKVSLYEVARRTSGFSGAQLENVLNEATLLAVRNDETIITTEHIDEAIDRVIGGLAKKNRTSSAQEREMIAYHEAGHALVGLYTKNTDIVEKITIIPRGRAAGYTLQTPAGAERKIQTKEDLLNMVRMTLGGRAAEEVIYGKNSITTGASNDLYKVTNIIKAMVTQLGMTEAGMTQYEPSEGFNNPYKKFFSEHTSRMIDAKIEEMIQKEYAQAKLTIKKHKKELDLIVETLLLVETILREDIEYIHKFKKLPECAVAAKLKIKKDKATKPTQNKSKDSSNSTSQSKNNKN